MTHRLRNKLNYSNVIATIALFAALSGVAVAAALPRNSVGKKQLKRGAVTAAKLRKAAVTSSKIAPGAVIAGKLSANAVGTGNLGNGVVSSAKLAKNSVINQSIAAGVVGTSKLGNGVVTTVKLADGSVATVKLANDSVTLAKLGPEVVPLLGTLRSGQTLRGSFTLGGTADAIGDKARTGQSFQFPLANAPIPNVIDPATATTGACPGITGGNGQTPGAAAGQLCFYVTNSNNVGVPTVPEVALNRLGFGLEVAATGPGDFSVSGQWAVTAP